MRKHYLTGTAFGLLSLGSNPCAAQRDSQIVTGSTVQTVSAPTGTTTTTTVNSVSGPAAVQAQAATVQAQAAAAKAVADARTSQAQARSAELSAVSSAFPTSPTSGTVTLQSGAGTEEANVLAAVALNDAARRISARIPKSASFLIVTGNALPDFSGWLSFDARCKWLKDQFSAAQAKYSQAENEKPVQVTKKDFTGIGEAATSLVKLAQLAATDWTAAGLTMNTDDYMLAVAVASRNGQASMYNQSNSLDAYSDIQTRLQELDALRANAAKNSAAASDEAKSLKEKAKKDKKQAGAMNAKAKDLDAAATALDAATAAYDTYVGQLAGVPAASGAASAAPSPTLSTILQQKAAYDFSTKGGVLFLRVHSSAGGLITEKNLLSALGSMPFFASGGVVVSYSYVNGTQRSSGLLPVVTPYVKVHQTRTLVNDCDAIPAKDKKRDGFDDYDGFCVGG